MLLDPTKKHIFIWVPGTGGHEVHPAFRAAVEKQLGDEAQLLHVEYPAIWNFDKSVPVGIKELTKMLKQVRKEKTPDQKVYVGGSSQGAWVISDVYNPQFGYDRIYSVSRTPNLPYNDIVTKTVIFGHPGVAHTHWHDRIEGSPMWEIDNPHDAVAYSWPGEERKLVRALGDLWKGKFWKLGTILWEVIKHPKKSSQLIWLILCATGVVWWTDSPHDYSQQMPLVVYWLIN